MSSFLIFFVVAACSALPQYPGYFNSLPQFPQQLPGFQFPQRPLPAWFNPNQLIGGPASLPPWLKPQPQPEADTTTENADNAVEVESARFIDNTSDNQIKESANEPEGTENPKVEGTATEDQAIADQKAYEENMKNYLTSGYGTIGGYSGYYPTGYSTGYTTGYSGYPSYTGGYSAGYGYPSGYAGGYSYPTGYSGNSVYASGYPSYTGGYGYTNGGYFGY